MTPHAPALLSLLVVLLLPATAAGQSEQLLEMKNTIENLVDALVEQGVLSAEKAHALKREAAAKAAAQAAQQAGRLEEQVPEPPAEGGSRVVRVPYVPEFVKEEIRDQVRAELREEVMQDVEQRAKEEKWGTPDALPDWVNTVSIHGDLRLRDQAEIYAGKNAPNTYPDFLEINDAGGIVRAGPDAFRNTTEDRNRLRVRLRLGIDAQLSESLKLGTRFASGNIQNPVSLNQTLGNMGRRYEFAIDQAYLRWQPGDQGRPWLTLYGGRFPHPWAGTDLVWDNDLGMEGAAATLRYAFDDPSRSHQSASHLFLTLGASSLDEVELSQRDKWMLGVQLGAQQALPEDSRAKLAVGFYDFRGVTGERNAFGSQTQDYTAPDYLQRGNSLFDIRNDADPTTNLFALASDYDVLSLFGSLDLGHMAPYHVQLRGEFASNLGFDKGQVLRRTGADISARTTAYMFDLTVGHPAIERFGQWQVSGGYRYVQRDAVLDAFTDSNFGLGGTDLQGYLLTFRYGLTDRTWASARWMSSNEIDGPPLGIDVLQVDLNARF